jgi:hypothetical protein
MARFYLGLPTLRTSGLKPARTDLPRQEDAAQTRVPNFYSHGVQGIAHSHPGEPFSQGFRENRTALRLQVGLCAIRQSGSR